MSATLTDRTLACFATATPKPRPERNEDAGAVAHLPHGELEAVVVADGLGSYSRARSAAVHAVYEAARWLRDSEEAFSRRSFPRLFADVHEALRSHASELAGGGEPEPRVFGTTLLVAVDTEEELMAAYAGNGAIWHIRGNFDQFPSAPWNAVNLLNPHSAGREALYSVLDASEPAPVPTVVTVSKDARFDDLLLLCTDGVSSADQATHGTDAGGDARTAAEPAMIAFQQAMRKLFASWDGASELPLQVALDGCLRALRSRGMLKDDATIGVLVTADALRYQRRVALGRHAEITRAAEDEAGCPSPEERSVSRRATESST